MEPLYRRRSPARVTSPSKITTNVDRSPGEKLKSRHVAQKGSQQTTKPRTPKSEAYTKPCGNEAGQLMSERERIHSKQPSPTLMKSLLADEMSKATEPKKRPPGIIAKLMGLDGLPSPRSTNKQLGRSSGGGGIQEKVPTGNGSSRNSRTCYNQAYNSAAKNQQLFKDVYEVRDSLKGRSDSYRAHTPPSRRQADDEVFVRPKFTDAKRPSTDEELQNSKEYDEALQVLNSNNHLFRKFLQEPDSLFAKHLHDLHDFDQSPCNHSRSLRASNILDYNINAIGSQVGREASRKIDISLSRDFSGRICSRDVQHSEKFVNPPAGFMEENAEPTQIVVLKPNFAKIQKATKSVPFSSSFTHELLSDVKQQSKRTEGGPLENGLRGKGNVPVELELSAHKSRESRELAKEITQKMRCSLGDGSLYLPWSGHRGYSADESSHDMSENDSSYDSDLSVSIRIPETPRRRSIQSKPLPSRYAESSVNREAKKRLSERWKMTQRREGKQIANYGSTLGEMLAIQDSDASPTNLEVSIGQDRLSSRFGSCDSFEGWVEPLGISSKDGCREGYIVSLPRCRSLPPPRDHSGRREDHNIHGLNKEGSRHGRRKIIRRDMSGKEGSYSGNLRPSDQESQSSSKISSTTMDRMEECQTGMHRKSVCSAEDTDSFELKTVILETPSCQPGKVLDSNAIVEAEREIIPETLNSGYHLVETASFSTCGQTKDDCSYCSGDSTSQETSISCQRNGSALPARRAAQPESHGSSKEVDQPSPVSVLEPPFVEDISSSSECFEKVSADLQGLRMQLQLLRLESNTYSEEDDGALQVSSDEEDEVTSLGINLPKPFLVEFNEYWEASYLGDVLASLCFDEFTPESFTSTWYSPDCPIGPTVFDKLEKTYVNETYCSRPERRLLFDRINAGILEISRKFMDPYPWVKSGLCGIAACRRWRKYELGADLWKVLESQEVEEESGDGIDLAAKDEEIEWVDLRKHLDGIGMEIEKMILEELSEEVFDDYIGKNNFVCSSINSFCY